MKNMNGTICNLCGKEFDEYDKLENRCFHGRFGYGSKHDGDKFELNLCCECFDKAFDYITPLCKHRPIDDGGINMWVPGGGFDEFETN